ncbi:hypothetical protein [Acidimangrovimonas sediminis]|uniref:hypothetical protein n=1 Tax=Acidimangrovimonas sediminis TaxID=2056283 RepID=UPI0011AED82F|nr:hypothetical protein [Acidimangrovimonas sediminis]
MLDWISAHSALLNVAINGGMLAVWVVYLQIFVTTYRQARSPRVLINRAMGSDIDAQCIVSNMSQEPVYPQSVYCTVHYRGGSFSATITDREIFQDTGRDQPKGVTAQGPLKQGAFLSLGSFRNLMDVTSRHSDEDSALARHDDAVEGMEIMVVCAFGGDNLEIAANRAFRIDTGTDPWSIIPRFPQTDQIAGRAERKRIRQRVIAELQER